MAKRTGKGSLQKNAVLNRMRGLSVVVALLCVIIGRSSAVAGDLRAIWVPLKSGTQTVQARADWTGRILDLIEAESAISLKKFTGAFYETPRKQDLIVLGKSENVDQVIHGQVTLLGLTTIIELYSIESASGRIKAQETIRLEGDQDEQKVLFEKGVNSFIRRMLDKKSVLYVKTTPEESTVLLDGKSVGFAPLVSELPVGVEYRVTAIRFGYDPAGETITLAEGDTTFIHFELEKAKKIKKRNEPDVHVYGFGGLPLNHSSSSVDTKLSLSGGRNLGGTIEFGKTWRVGVAALFYEAELKNVEENALAEMGVNQRPEASANLLYATLTYMMGTKVVSPYLGVGLAAMDRGVQLADDTREERLNTTVEAGVLLMTGFDIAVSSTIRIRFDVSHARSISRSDSWWDSDDGAPAEGWVRSFDAFESLTALRLGVGIKL